MDSQTFDNRVGWAATCLYRVGLLAQPRRSVYAITDRGSQVLAEQPDWIDLTVLSQFPEFRKARGTGRTTAATTPAAVTDTATPEERMEAAYQELREALIGEVRDRIAAMPPSAFEAIGSAKDLTEATLRAALSQLGEPWGPGDEPTRGRPSSAPSRATRERKSRRPPT